MAKVSVDIFVPVVGKTLNLMVPADVDCSVLLMMATQFAEDRFHIDSQGELFFAKNGQKVNPISSFASLDEEMGQTFILM